MYFIDLNVKVYIEFKNIENVIKLCIENMKKLNKSEYTYLPINMKYIIFL